MPRAPLIGALLLAGLSSACANEPYPDGPEVRSVSAELFHFVCKRVAREPEDVRRTDLSGMRYDQLCDDPPADLEGEPLLDDNPRLRSLIERRQAVVDALAQTIGDMPVEGGASFEEDEIVEFLNSMVPFYDDLRLPTVTRKTAELLGLVIDPNDARAVAVIDQLSKISPRMGYRVAQRALGAVRPFLSYPQLDDLSRIMLGLFGTGGDAHDELAALLKPAALELAEEAEPKDDPSTLHVALELLLSEDPALAEGGNKLYTVRRDPRGYASAVMSEPFVDQDGDGLADLDETGRFVVEGGAANGSPFPFAKARGGDPVVERNGEGLAVNGAGQPMFEYFDANATVLAAGMREAKPLVERDEPGKPSAIENASRGLRPMLGPTSQRSYDFAGKPYAFEGPDLTKSPVLDLLHAGAQILKQDETRRVLLLVKELMGNDAHEPSAAGPVHAAIAIDDRSDNHPSAFLTGFDGKQGSPSEWWDDGIALATRILERPGLLNALFTAFADKNSAAQGALFATWMKHNDVVKYVNAEFEADMATGKFTEAQAKDMNAVRSDYQYMSPVDRAMPDVGMNRSIWQRTMSLLHSLNGTRLCNKEGATVSTLVAGLPLTFPVGGTYKECDFVEIPDPGEAYTKSVLDIFEVNLKDQGLKDLASLGAAIGLTGNTSQIQEAESQIVGFNDKPTPQSLARMMFAPQNKFMRDLFGDILTTDGVPLRAYEPYALFPMEVEDPTATVDGVPQSFIVNGRPLLNAFETHELRDGDKLLDGYMFGHFLDYFHMHWASPKAEPCPDVVEAGREGCTQSLDPTKKFWSYQSNVVSYEPLIIEAFADEKLTAILQKASADLQTITIEEKDGLTVLTDFVEMLLRSADPTQPAAEGALAYRDGRTWAATNTCVIPAGADPKVAPAQCDCPTGSTPEGELCRVGDRLVPRGKIVGLSPLYLLLDALKGIDKAFEGDNKERHDAWLLARGKLVDQFLGSSAVTGEELTYRFSNQRARKIAVKGLEWAIARIDDHQGDLASWADGLVPRAEKVLSHPLVGRALDVLDVFWNDPDAGDQFAGIATYLMDAEQYPDAFNGLVIAVADTLTFLDRDPGLTPIVQFASLAIAPDAFAALDGGGEPNVDNGVLLKGLDLVRDIVGLHEGEEPSALSKLLKNAVLANEAGESPLEVIFDTIAEVNRLDALQPSDMPMSPDDARDSLKRTHDFLLDEERGLERIYRVIQSRNLGQGPVEDRESTPSESDN